MDQGEFKRLTGTCDYILSRFSTDDAIVAIPWLHVLNCHPNSIARYNQVFKRRSFFSALVFFLNNTGYLFLKLLQAIVTIGNNKIKKEVAQAHVLFVSHFVDFSVLQKDNDFYFGSLPRNLKKATGQTAAIGLIDHTPLQKSVKERNKIETGDPEKILFLKTISFAKEFQFARKCFSSYTKLTRAAKQEIDPEIKNILHESALYALAPETLTALRIQEHIYNLLLQTNASALVITWEGRSWERLAIHAARSFKKTIKCLAYQHTVVLESSHALTKSMGKSYDPHVIFTIGQKTAAIIQAKNEFKHTEIISYGSYRLPVTKAENPERSGKSLQCLVTPEGIESECVLLFDFAIRLAKISADINFIFRTHPVLPYQLLTKKYKRFITLPPNCVLSDAIDIDEDFKRADFLLYRGSSVCLYAIMRGLRPVYYALAGEIPIDPLYQLSGWRLKVKTEQEFVDVVAAHAQTPAPLKNEMYTEALAYCKDYLQLPDEDVFYNSLPSK